MAEHGVGDSLTDTGEELDYEVLYKCHASRGLTDRGERGKTIHLISV